MAEQGHPPFLVLIDFENHIFAKARFDGHNVRQSTLNHLAFEIAGANYVAQLDRLEQLGLQPTTTEFPAMNAKAIFFGDPEGNTLELICPK